VLHICLNNHADLAMACIFAFQLYLTPNVLSLSPPLWWPLFGQLQAARHAKHSAGNLALLHDLRYVVGPTYPRQTRARREVRPCRMQFQMDAVCMLLGWYTRISELLLRIPRGGAQFRTRLMHPRCPE